VVWHPGLLLLPELPRTPIPRCSVHEILWELKDCF
jgi:hypothetical protein